MHILEKDRLLPHTLLPFKGTQKVHQIVWCNNKSESVVLRNLSGIEKSCLTEVGFSNHGKHLGFHDLVTEHMSVAKA